LKRIARPLRRLPPQPAAASRPRARGPPGRRSGSTIAVERFTALDAATPPAFNGSGDRFLVIADALELRHYGFRHGPLLGSMRWPFDEMDNQIGDLVLFADPAHALVTSTADRLCLVDLTEMAIVDEIDIGGSAQLALPDGRILSVHGDSLLTWRCAF
jgi:hypothetical protein